MQDFVIQLKDMIKLCPKAKRLNFIGFYKVGLPGFGGERACQCCKEWSTIGGDKEQVATLGP